MQRRGLSQNNGSLFLLVTGEDEWVKVFQSLISQQQGANRVYGFNFFSVGGTVK